MSRKKTLCLLLLSAAACFSSWAKGSEAAAGGDGRLPRRAPLERQNTIETFDAIEKMLREATQDIEEMAAKAQKGEADESSLVTSGLPKATPSSSVDETPSQKPPLEQPPPQQPAQSSKDQDVSGVSDSKSLPTRPPLVRVSSFEWPPHISAREDSEVPGKLAVPRRYLRTPERRHKALAARYPFPLHEEQTDGDNKTSGFLRKKPTLPPRPKATVESPKKLQPQPSADAELTHHLFRRRQRLEGTSEEITEHDVAQGAGPSTE